MRGHCPGISRVITVKVCLGHMLTLGSDDLTPGSTDSGKGVRTYPNHLFDKNTEAYND